MTDEHERFSKILAIVEGREEIREGRPSGLAAERRPGPPPFAFKLFDQIDPTPRKDWLVRGALGAGEFSVLYGDPGSGKSVFATDLAFAVSTGSDWFGRTVKRGAVMYVAAERAKLTERRLAALRCKNEQAEPLLAILEGRFDLFGSEEDARRLISTSDAVCQATGEPVCLIIVDTVARVIPGADENTARDISRFASNVDLIREQTGAHVLVVHHAGKDESKKMRGSTALLGAADTTMVVKKLEDGLRTATIDKSNDEGEGEAFTFTLQSVELFVDPDTQEVTTAPVVESSDKPPPRPAQPRDRLSAGDKAVLDCLHRAIGEHGQPPPPEAGFPPSVTIVVNEAHWRRLVYQHTGTAEESTAAKRTRFNRAIDNLIAKHLIARNGDWIWPAR